MPFVEIKKDGKTTFRYVKDLKDYEKKDIKTKNKGI